MLRKIIFIIIVIDMKTSRLLHIMKNKMYHFECYALNFIENL